jgi:hypothetical protein
MIAKAIEVLAWQDGEGSADAVFRSYVLLLTERFAALLHCLSVDHPKLAAALKDIIATVSDAAFIRVLTAPESSFRILQYSDANAADRAHFLILAFRAEAVRERRSVSVNECLWSALGDFRVLTDGSVRQEWLIPGMIPIDLGSPHARSTATDEMQRDGACLNFVEFSELEAHSLLVTLQTAGEAIRATSLQVHEFICMFTRVLVCVKDAVAPSSFASGTTGQYIGRSFLANPQLDSVDSVAIADAMLHESIHGYLFMLEREHRWVSAQLYRGNDWITSPWSGAKLRIRPYLQACFVWYGLLQFWCLALETGRWSEQGIRNRIRTSALGFLNGPLTEPLDAFGDQISADVRRTITSMQDFVIESYTYVNNRSAGAYFDHASSRLP